jgi:hypothetical protein
MMGFLKWVGSFGSTHIDAGGVQHQTVFAFAVIGPADEASHPASGSPPTGERAISTKGLATGHDRYPAAHLARNAGFHLVGMVVQQEAADGDAGRRLCGFRRRRHLTGDGQAIVGGGMTAW